LLGGKIKALKDTANTLRNRFAFMRLPLTANDFGGLVSRGAVTAAGSLAGDLPKDGVRFDLPIALAGARGSCLLGLMRIESGQMPLTYHDAT